MTEVKTDESSVIKKEEPFFVSTVWFREWIGEENFSHHWTNAGPIVWNKIPWSGGGSSRDPSDYLPQCGADVPKWLFAVARNAKNYHYGSYELQIALATLVSRPRSDVSLEAVENEIKGSSDLMNEDVVPYYNHYHRNVNIGVLILDALERRLLMDGKNYNHGGSFPMFHSFYNEYLFKGEKNGTCECRNRSNRYLETMPAKE